MRYAGGVTETPPGNPPWQDVQWLLDASEPRPRVNYFWYGVGAFLFVSLGGAYLAETTPNGQILVQGVSILLTVGLIAGMSFFTMFAMQRLKAAQQQIEAAAELVQLRRWQQASVMLTQILSQPVRTHAMRFEALLYLISVLTRYDRFEDALAVQEHLLENNLDPTTERAIKLGRAMAMLRLDRLFDADRAIADLRRGEARDTSGGLALVEIFRDIKTGHPAEAIEIAGQRSEILRDQLSHRVADVHVLVAKAHDQLEQPAEAQRAFTNATLLAPFEELVRRYPEVAGLDQKYAVARAPDAAPAMPDTLGGSGPAQIAPVGDRPQLTSPGGRGTGNRSDSERFPEASNTLSLPLGESGSEGELRTTPPGETNAPGEEKSSDPEGPQ